LLNYVLIEGGTVADEACCRGIEVEEPPGEGAPPPPADSWEEAADGDNDPLLTPENEPEVEEDEDEAEEVIKPKKRPVNKTEETKSKKEHVNVVFIGHVGK
jgi:peptide chain release factor subunit 3